MKAQSIVNKVVPGWSSHENYTIDGRGIGGWWKEEQVEKKKGKNLFHEKRSYSHSWS